MKNILALLCALNMSAAHAGFIKTHPRFANLTPKNLDNIDLIIKSEVENKTIDSALVFATRNQALVYQKGFGSIDANHKFEIEDLTFPIATLPTILQLVEQGKITLMEVAESIRGNGDSSRTESFLETILKRPFTEYVQAELFERIGMNDTRIVKNDDDKQQSKITTTAGDLALFCLMILNNGVVEKKSVLSPASMHIFTDMIRGYRNNQKTTGAFVNGDFFKNAYGLSNMAGTSMLIDPATKMIIVSYIKTHNLKSQSSTNVHSKIVNIFAGAVKPESLDEIRTVKGNARSEK